MNVISFFVVVFVKVKRNEFRSRKALISLCFSVNYAGLRLFPSQRSLSVRAVVSTSWTSSSWRCWTDTGTPSASSAPTARHRWRTNVSPGQEASTARRISSSKCASSFAFSPYHPRGLFPAEWALAQPFSRAALTNITIFLDKNPTVTCNSSGAFSIATDWFPFANTVKMLAI